MHLLPTFNIPQAKFLTLDKKFKAYVGGFGCGKTYVGCAGLCKNAYELPNIQQGYFAPTYTHIRDIFYPTIEEVAEKWGLSVKILKGDKEVSLIHRGRVRSKIICRSLDRPETIVGFKIGHALIDELDVMTVEKAALSWRKIIARMRDNTKGVKNTVDVTTTPEGFRFVHNQFVKQIAEKPNLAEIYGMVQASTYDNAANLPNGYISSLEASYPAQLIEAYLNGQFVNLNSGSVYPAFKRDKNNTQATLQDNETLHIGMDFNVMNMSAVICVIRDGLPYALQELTGIRDTPTMAATLADRFRGHSLVIYPDASGQNTSSKNASQSDLSILRQAGFTVRVNTQNPRVRDRVLAVNAMLENSQGERRLFINTAACPKLTEALEQQSYDKNGEPDKSTGHDHINDSLGYFLAYEYPIHRPQFMVGKTNL